MKRSWMSKVLVLLALLAFAALPAMAQQAMAGAGSPNDVSFSLNMKGGNFSQVVNIFLMMTVLSLVPAFVTMMTSFLRISIVLGFLKQALGAQNVPSSQMINALALFLTIFIMQPVFTEIYDDAIKPYSNNEISMDLAWDRGSAPLKRFMIKQTRETSILLFMELSEMEPVESPDALPMSVIVPAFMLSELSTAFQMGFLIYLPFLLIDLVTSTVLMAMGMMMLPPMMISLPFKLLLFIIVNGWELVVKSLVNSFQ